MAKFFKGVVCAGVVLLCFACMKTTARANPVTLNEMFTTNGTDIIAMFDISDLARNASNNLPITFNVTLIRNGTVVGGPVPVTLTVDNTTMTGLGGYTTSAKLTITFSGAAGAGTNTLQIQAVPEPATLLLFGTGLAGVIAGIRRRRNDRWLS